MRSSGDKELVVRSESGTEVSFQLYQDVYNTLTGRTERISRFFYNPHRARLYDFEQLQFRVQQTIEQYDCRNSKLTVTVRFANGKAERFSSFEKFAQQASNRTYAVESVELEYNFLFLLPKTQEPKPYKLEIGLRSTLGVFEYLREKNASSTEFDMMCDFRQATGRLVVEYVDLAVARNLEAQIDDWYEGLGRLPTRLGKFSRSISSSCSVLLRVLALVAAALFLTNSFSEIGTLNDLIAATVITVATFAVIGHLTFPLANLVSRWLKRTGAQSVIILSKADESLEQKFLTSPLKALGKSFASIIGAIFIGLATSYLATILGM